MAAIQFMDIPKVFFRSMHIQLNISIQEIKKPPPANLRGLCVLAAFDWRLNVRHDPPVPLGAGFPRYRT